jgi:hypothetical protein
MHIHDLGGIRTRDPSNQAAKDPRLRPLSRRNLLVTYQLNNNISPWSRVLFENLIVKFPQQTTEFPCVKTNPKVHSLPLLKETVTCLYFKPQVWIQTLALFEEPF